MNEWEVMRLDEVADRIAVKNSAGHQRVLTVAAGHGLVDQETYFNKRVASSDLSGYWIVEPGDFVYNKSTSKEAPWGVVARWDGDEPAVVTTLYIVFRARPNIESDYLLHACNGTYFFNSLRGKLREGARAHGLLNVRLAEFFGAQLVVPPIDEQRRIVDVTASVDAQIEALVAEADSLIRLARARRSQLVNDELVPEVRAHQAFEFSTGVRRTPDRANGPNMTRYLRSANVGYGSLDLSDVLEMNYEPHEREKFSLRHGDVLVSEGSASAKAVGMPAMWRDEIPGPVCFQMTLLRLRAIAEVCTPDFAFQWCLWAYEAGRFLDVAGGTNIKHISAKRSSQMPVRLPSLTRQREIALELDSLDVQLTSLRCELAQLHSFRSALLPSLLSRQFQIPSSYDVLLEAVL
jgi:restriction endonuclease S subunit